MCVTCNQICVQYAGRTRRKKTCAPGAVKGGGGPKPTGGPSFVPPPPKPGASGAVQGTKTGDLTTGGGPVCEADLDFAIQDVRKGFCF